MEEVDHSHHGLSNMLEDIKIARQNIFFIQWDKLSNLFSLQEIMVLFYWEFQLKKTPQMGFWPLVQLDQNAILKKSFQIKPF
jgi:hypothetical protein